MMRENRYRRAVLGIAVVAASSLCFAVETRARSEPRMLSGNDLPFNRALSNIGPLAFGMDAADAARVLGVPLVYVQGRPGNETFFAIRNDGGSGFFPRDDRLYLQFRRGRLTGIKGDWGRNWMWR